MDGIELYKYVVEVIQDMVERHKKRIDETDNDDKKKFDQEMMENWKKLKVKYQKELKNLEYALTNDEEI